MTQKYNCGGCNINESMSKVLTKKDPNTNNNKF